MKQKGFSLVELVLVLIILIVLAAGSIIYIGFFQGIKLQSAAEKLANDIKYAQNTAVSKTVWYGVKFEVDPVNRYSIYYTDGTTDTLEADPADFSKILSVDTNEKFGAKINSVMLEGGQNQIEFNGLGHPYTDYLGWVVSNEGSIVLQSGSQTKTIKITPNTGNVVIE
ncbi:MAG: Uncharacterized protein FD145_890 [Candidatus Saganbacteria bacterium]|uniref:General secretion pathway GspH domain-containing protein n=1 Tax=Candidatus Saganbacteria bacterium TaxID=2575572 RepID=A0A833L3K1_UNCSA|nr:MAG: Uncharacterized protein FD145_890 [Candidatus Saganbacteria bacterium]